ncbi:MAG: hypothetical protein HY063_01190 [Bacteroidetes bacterium]|nr:hypothetical protein [Bacteroidota bacterium]
MKTLIIIFACGLSFSLFAQNIETDTAKNCLTLRNGKVIIKQQGKATELRQDTILANGIKITPNGTIIRKDGTKTTMQTGQCFSMEGIRMTDEPGKGRKSAVKKTSEE